MTDVTARQPCRSARAMTALLLALPCAVGFMQQMPAVQPATQPKDVTQSCPVETKHRCQLRQHRAQCRCTCMAAPNGHTGAATTVNSITTSRQSTSTRLSISANVGTPESLAYRHARRLGDGALNDVEILSGPDDAARRLATLERAYKECERITSIFAKTFYLGTKFMPATAQQAVWAIYVWCRRTDDIVDGPRAMVRGQASMQADLDDWTQRLEDIWAGKPRDALDLALADVHVQYPSLPMAPFQDMIDGMIMDVPGLGQSRYKTFQELELYCYRVAGTVGLMTLPILGTAKGVTEAEAKEPALSLGIALQLTNILRDVGEDAVRGRIYLPLEDLERFNIPQENILNGILDNNYKEMMKFQIARARYYYRQAARGVPMLAPESRLPVQASLDMYGRILEVIEENNYDNFRKRAYVSKSQKFMRLPVSWWQSMHPEGNVQEDPEDQRFKLTRFDLESRHNLPAV